MSDLDTALIEAQGAHVEGGCRCSWGAAEANMETGETEIHHWGGPHATTDPRCIALRLDKQADAWEAIWKNPPEGFIQVVAHDIMRYYRRLARKVREEECTP